MDKSSEPKESDRQDENELPQVDPSDPTEVLAADTINPLTEPLSNLIPPSSDHGLRFEIRRRTIRGGPLPDPETLREYKKIHPKAIELIFDAAQTQARHRQELETSVISTKNKLAERGQIIGAALGAIGLIGSFVVIGLGHDAAGATIAGGCVLSLAALFVYGKDQQSGELKKKQEVKEQTEKENPIETLEEE